MEIISIPQLRMGQLQQLAESSLEITKPIEALKPSWKVVSAAFEAFVTGMKKDSASSDKKTLDKTRDLLLSGFFFAVKAEEYHPYTVAAVMEKIDKLREIKRKGCPN